jgi:alpha-glucuronidase
LFCRFLDITQAFNKVRHTGLLYKIKLSLPFNYLIFLKSYLQNKDFLVKIENEYIELSPVNVGVPQGSVLGPLLYLLFTADLPISPQTISATFADGTAVIATGNDPAMASSKLQTNLLAIQSWLAKWRMKANGSKSTHITFTTRKGTCPSVHINNVQLPQSEEGKYLGLHLDRRLT